jgi:putative NIF3 family GTP cyclohydrolase 1 type 2
MLKHAVLFDIIDFKKSFFMKEALMIKLKTLIDYAHILFDTTDLETYQDECGITYDAGRPIKKIAYATNLTPDTVRAAHTLNADLLITHHDAWGFIDGMKEACIQLLKEYEISHFFTHLPLDDAPFGTNHSLLDITGATLISKEADYLGYKTAVLGKYENPIPFSDLINRLENAMQEPIMHWQNHDRLIQSVYILCGGGESVELVKDAVDLNADVYITGEKVLYTMQYAKLKGINLMIGSHTYTEIFGVKNFVGLLKEKFNDLETYLIDEEHLETSGFNHLSE